MFAYCGNNSVNYTDPSGHAYKDLNKQINYCEYEHTYGGLRENFYALPSQIKFDGISESWIETTEQVSGGTKTGKVLGFELDLFSIAPHEITVISADLTGVSIDLANTYGTLSLFDLGNASVSAGIKDYHPYAGVMVSLWSPSVSIDILGLDVTTALHVGALGAELSLIPGDYRVGLSKGLDFSFAINWP